MRYTKLTVVLLLAALIIAGVLLAQDKGVAKFSSETNLVVVDLYARDKSGAIITNLKKEDFTVLEDGKPQLISVFELQKLDSAVLPEIVDQPRTLLQRNVVVPIPAKPPV